ncbi:MAG: hypothetical protein ACPGYP_07110 [Solirubrobacterales bacterium]
MQLRLSQDLKPIVDWDVTAHGFITAITTIDVTDIWPVSVHQRSLVVGNVRGSVRTIDGIASDAIAADGHRVAALRWNRSQRLEYVVYQVGTRSIRRLKSALVPGMPQRVPLPGKSLGFPTAVLDLNGSSIAVGVLGNATVFNWRTGKIETSIATPQTGLMAIALADQSVTVDTSYTGHKYLPSKFEFAAFTRPDGQRTWSVDGQYASLNIQHSLAAIVGENRQVSHIERFDAGTGARVQIGVFPQYPSDSPNMLSGAGFGVQDLKLTWVEHGCYWSNVLVKPIGEPVTRSLPDCELQVAARSLALRGRTLSVRARTSTGVKISKVLASVGMVAGPYRARPIAPGTRTIRLKIGPRMARLLRRTNGGPITLVFDPAPGAPVTVTGKVKLVR